MTALDRLAMRQKFIEQNHSTQPAVTSATSVSTTSHNGVTNGIQSNGVISNGSISPTNSTSSTNDSNATTATMGSQTHLKRDMFFNSSSNAAAINAKKVRLFYFSCGGGELNFRYNLYLAKNR